MNSLLLFCKDFVKKLQNFFSKTPPDFFPVFFNVDMNLIPYIFTIVLIIFYSHKFFLLNLLAPKVFLHCGVFRYRYSLKFWISSFNIFVFLKFYLVLILFGEFPENFPTIFRRAIYRTSCLEMFFKKVFLKISQISVGGSKKHWWWRLF